MKINEVYILLILFVLISCSGLAQENSIKKNYQYKTDEEWQSTLPKMSYLVLRKAATEYPFTGKYNKDNGQGVYQCVGCGKPALRVK